MVLIECGVFGDLGTGMHGDDSGVRGVFLFFFYQQHKDIRT